MASWIDVFSLLITTLLSVGFILAVLYAAHAISTRFESVKALLQNRGITVSRDGVSFKTQHRFDRDAYVDATQRGLVKAFGAATVGPESHQHSFLSPSSHEVHASRMSMRKSHGGGQEDERY